MRPGSATEVVSAVLCVAFFALSGCTLTKMETARQLEGGQWTGSGTVETNFHIPSPRASVAFRRGVGGFGDTGVSLGVNPLGTVSATWSNRLYAGPYLNASLQVGGGVHLLALAEGFMGWGVVTPRLTTSVDEARPVYGGIQVNLVALDPDGPILNYYLPGIILGFEVPLGEGATHSVGFQSIQGEVIFTPITNEQFPESSARRPDIDHPEYGEWYRGSDAYAFTQVSLGFHVGGAGEGGEELEPTPVPDDDASPQEPEYDEDGVPVY